MKDTDEHWKDHFRHKTPVDDLVLKKLYKVRDRVAVLVCSDAEYIPIFIRLESEIKLAEAMRSEIEDPLEKARYIAATYLQMPMGALKSGVPTNSQGPVLDGIGL